MTGVPVLVGRTAELAVVRGRVDAALRGQGGVLAITGEAGIGKSRLLAEVVARAERAGMRVLTGRAVAGGGTLRPVAAALVEALRDGGIADAAELRPYRTALGRLVPGLAPSAVPEPGLDPVLVLGEGVLRLLRTLGGAPGCLLAMEDLHHSDAETLAALVNGTTAHAYEHDSLRFPSAGVHPGATIVPAALATAQSSGADGRTLLAGRHLADDLLPARPGHRGARHARMVVARRAEQGLGRGDGHRA